MVSKGLKWLNFFTLKALFFGGGHETPLNRQPLTNAFFLGLPLNHGHKYTLTSKYAVDVK